MTITESTHQVWDERDEQFFSITASLFTPAFCFGASVLLASYNTNDLIPATGPSAPAAPWDGVPAVASQDLPSGAYLHRASRWHPPSTDQLGAPR